MIEPVIEDTRIYGSGGHSERGWWVGKGTEGRKAVYAKHAHGYRAYWWYVGLDGTHRGLEWCEHAHKSPATARECGEREARRRNVALRRVRGAPGA